MPGELGILAAMVTPYDELGEVAPDMVARLTEYILGGGADGIYVCGTTGEFPLLSVKERCEIVQTVLSRARKEKGKKVIVNVSAQRSDEVVRLCANALEHGADALSMVAPSYYHYDADAMLQYFQWFADLAREVPIYLYNMPANTGNPILPELIPRLRQACANVRGIKDSSMDFMVLTDYIKAGGENFQVLTGNDAQVLWALEAGGSGAVVASAGVFPGQAKQIHSAWKEGRPEEARQAQALLYRYRQICRTIMPGMAQKKTLEFLGFPMGRRRLPFRELTAQEEKHLYEELCCSGLFPQREHGRPSRGWGAKT